MQQPDETSAAETAQGTGQSTALVIAPSAIASPVNTELLEPDDPGYAYCGGRPSYTR